MIGIDEVGRGCIAGDVFACALFCENETRFNFIIKDSKKLSSINRQKIYNDICNRNDVKFAIGIATIEEIEKLNILNATLLAMERAYFKLGIFNTKVLIDGNKKPERILNAECIIGGDNSVLQISLASIMAKVTRDNIMTELSKQIPIYEFEKHKGYGTKRHFELIKQFGISEFHRKSWCNIS